MIGQQVCLRENDDLYMASSGRKEKPLVTLVTLVTREIMRSKDAQCNTE